MRGCIGNRAQGLPRTPGCMATLLRVHGRPRGCIVPGPCASGALLGGAFGPLLLCILIPAGRSGSGAISGPVPRPCPAASDRHGVRPLRAPHRRALPDAFAGYARTRRGRPAAPDGSQHHGLLGCARRAREHPRGHDRAQAQHFAALAPVPARGHHPGRRCPEGDRLPWGSCGGKIPHPSSQPPPAPVTTRLPLPRILFFHHQKGRPPHGGGEGPREIGGGLQQTLTSPVRRGASRGVRSVTVVTVSPGPATRALLGGVGYEGTRLPRRGGSRQTLTTVTNPHPPREGRW